MYHNLLHHIILFKVQSQQLVEERGRFWRSLYTFTHLYTSMENKRSVWGILKNSKEFQRTLVYMLYITFM